MKPLKAPPDLSLDDLLTHLIEAEIEFVFAHMPEKEADERYGCAVHGEQATGPSAVETVLSALALGMRKEEAEIATRTKKLTRAVSRVAKIQERLPGLSAHLPSGDDGRCQCGEVHKGPEAVIRAMLGGLIGGGTVTVTEVVRSPEKKKRQKKTPN